MITEIRTYKRLELTPEDAIISKQICPHLQNLFCAEESDYRQILAAVDETEDKKWFWFRGEGTRV